MNNQVRERLVEPSAAPPRTPQYYISTLTLMCASAWSSLLPHPLILLELLPPSVSRPLPPPPPALVGAVLGSDDAMGIWKNLEIAWELKSTGDRSGGGDKGGNYTNYYYTPPWHLDPTCDQSRPVTNPDLGGGGGRGDRGEGGADGGLMRALEGALVDGDELELLDGRVDLRVDGARAGALSGALEDGDQENRDVKSSIDELEGSPDATLGTMAANAELQERAWTVPGAWTVSGSVQPGTWGVLSALSAGTRHALLVFGSVPINHENGSGGFGFGGVGGGICFGGNWLPLWVVPVSLRKGEREGSWLARLRPGSAPFANPAALAALAGVPNISQFY
ncbi:hypothetical protein T492DRAFT_832603 [Pavlovales sp. CCMP2436]|nr:hypothetical protein T492DRAFT_832603 [Pavlovales sp. CCMP2436]